MIVFRCDSSFEIGTGHVMRCLNLAFVLKPLGFSIEFVCENRPGHIADRIEKSGFKAHIVEKGEDLGLIQNLGPQWVIVDHYGIDEAWEKKLPAATKIFVIDDLVNRRHHCDILLDQNYRKETPDYKSLVPTSCRLLLGPQYSLLKPELTTKPAPKKMSMKPKVLVFFGGSDESGETEKFAKALANFGHSASFLLVGLSSQKHLASLRTLNLPPHIELRIDPPNWLELLQTSDFYIGSGGTVTWERMFLGLPGAILAVAENQVGPNQDLADQGYQIFWGLAQEFNHSKLPSLMMNLLFQSQTLEKMAARAQELISKFDSKLAKEIFILSQPQ
jgi:UDP-2,4-diacetamido-2,4,6-trideoxy-beta-L-altropyranose hydrolase